MEIIPVIDVRHGQAVRAVAGERANYRPFDTPLAPGSSDPVDVARGFLKLYPFNTLYVADLDGIEGRGTNSTLVSRLSAACSGPSWWVDNGSANDPAIEVVMSSGLVRTVVGSETGIAPTELAHEIKRWRGRLVLSLDYKGDRFQGTPALLSQLDLWPAHIIVMTLGRVGTATGPDLDCIHTIAKYAGSRRVYAAGGIRNRADVRAAFDAGARGALIATALHNGHIKTGDLEEIAGW